MVQQSHSFTLLRFQSLGIDLGTTNSAAATLVAGQPSILPNANGSRLTPSVIGVTKQDSFVIGDVAKRQAVVNPENTFYSVKSFIGRRYDALQQDLDALPFQVKPGPNDLVKIHCPQLQSDFYPEQLSSKIVAGLMENFRRSLAKEPTLGVITVPAYFDDAQRNATRDAGSIAGLDVQRIVNEPTAAALAYGFDKEGNSMIFVFDAGGGTFDVSLLEAGDGVFEVIKTGGDSSLGGDVIDEKIIDWLVRGFSRKHGIVLQEDLMTRQRLKEAAEKSKIELSTVTSAPVNLPFIANDQGRPKHLLITLTRDILDDLIDGILYRFKIPMLEVLNEANLSPGEIDHVILVGGTTRIPLIRNLVQKELQIEPNSRINPDEVVALGAAIQAGVIGGDTSDIVLIDVTPLSLGLETLGGVNTKLIPRNTSLPTSKNEIFSTAIDNQNAVEINVLQGEREFASNCKPLGTFKLTGIQPAPRGVPQIEVGFQIDVNGILKVTATDKTTGASRDLEINDSNRRSQEEIDQIIKDAQTFSQNDFENRKIVDATNTAEVTLYTAQKLLQEEGDRLGQDKTQEVQAAIDTLRSAINQGDAESIQEQTTELLTRINEAKKPEDPNERNSSTNDSK
eukprot:CAMPEP_0114505178 /NCGR_PEP_ID=MMETSP0109-20121206/10707_1 /TAXON_ID=29199 /ORGANISM="Chlorarachnion reptans, Strain CCCM449" /LENGTH=621 /DNA_ID=CAMNT_0001683585 /DNA_START=1747 /DNA_END=3612 /DNA_ORIENTATION=+